jgi:hypothetical protein
MECESVRRTPRYSLSVDIEMTDIKLGIRITTRTKMLSMFGCGVDAVKLFPQGTNVRIMLSHQGADVRAFGKVVYSSSDLGMGLAFTNVRQEDERILERWIVQSVSIPIRGR